MQRTLTLMSRKKGGRRQEGDANLSCRPGCGKEQGTANVQYIYDAREGEGRGREEESSIDWKAGGKRPTIPIPHLEGGEGCVSAWGKYSFLSLMEKGKKEHSPGRNRNTQKGGVSARPGKRSPITVRLESGKSGCRAVKPETGKRRGGEKKGEKNRTQAFDFLLRPLQVRRRRTEANF